ncbi:ACP S-malonyltransferase [Streptomyces ehimensis]|uniref:[acyl-carrier-protein] S-malonyltransferase n=1 Tax=Streptomyces ehimensis TaxID=68195 RepID=A0ABV9BTP9_9ACTN
MEDGDMLANAAVVFPGMGPTRFADAGKFLLLDPVARRLLERADKRLGYSLMDEWYGMEGDYSEYAQVAFFVSCLAMAEWAERELGVRPGVCVGASFGERPAAVHAGSLSFEDGVWMTAALARCIDAYFAEQHGDVVTQSLARTPRAGLEEALHKLAERGEWYDISGHLDDDFHMVSVRERNLGWLEEAVRRLGGLPLYAMRPPMHSRLFEDLGFRAEEEVLDRLAFEPPVLPLVLAQGGDVVRSADGVRAALAASFVSLLDWPAALTTLRQLGTETLCVSGPDSLFSRLSSTTNGFQVITASPLNVLRPRRQPTTS